MKSAKMYRAVIFDMDGLLIDSEPLWSKAENLVFSSLGVELEDSLCKITATMTTKDVTEFWYERCPWSNKTLEAAENDVIDCVEELIRKHGKPMPGAKEIVNYFHRKSYKIGLSTNSPYKLIETVLERLDVAQYFDAVSSSEQVTSGKPDPAVYYSTLRKLDTLSYECLAFEDSVSGVMAATEAGIKTFAVPKPDDFDNPGFSLAFKRLSSLWGFSESIIY